VYGIAASTANWCVYRNVASATGPSGAAICSFHRGVVRAGEGGLIAIWSDGWRTAIVGVGSIEPGVWYEWGGDGFVPVPDTDPRVQAYYDKYPQDRPAVAYAEPKSEPESVAARLRSLADEIETGGAA